MAADRLVSLGRSLEFEGVDRKIFPLSRGAVVAATGNSEDASFIDKRLRHTAELMANVSVYQIARRMRRLCENRRAQLISESITRPYLNLSFAKFTAMCADKRRDVPLINNVFKLAQDFNFQLRMLVAGIDDFGAQLYVVTNKGVADNTSAGFAAIGAGADSAIDTIVTRRMMFREMNLSNAIYAVFAAKRAAQSVPGVGRASDVALVRQGVEATFLGKEQLKALSKMHRRMEPPKLSDDDASQIGGWFS